MVLDSDSDRGATIVPLTANLCCDGFAAALQAHAPLLDRACAVNSWHGSPTRHRGRCSARAAERSQSQSDRSRPARVLHVLAGGDPDRLGIDRIAHALSTSGAAQFVSVVPGLIPSM